MALQKIFLSQPKPRNKVGNAISTEYEFDGDILRVWWKDELCYEATAIAGEAYVVNCGGSKPQINPFTPPKKKVDIAMWLCGFPKALRCYTWETYQEKLKEMRVENNWWGYHESYQKDKKHDPPRWEMSICNRSDCAGIDYLAFYLNSEATDEDIVNFLNGCDTLRGFYYPKEFVETNAKRLLGIEYKIPDDED